MQRKGRHLLASLKVKVRLINQTTGEIKEQEVFMGDSPLMTDAGTFVINGAGARHREPALFVLQAYTIHMKRILTANGVIQPH